jgi:hypothetical protein
MGVGQMADVLSTSILTVAGISTLLYAGSEAVRSQVWKNFKLKLSAKEILPYLAFTGVLGTFTYLGVIQDNDFNACWLAFMGAMLLPFLLSRLGLSSCLLGTILFACSLAFRCYEPSWQYGCLSALGGLLTYKVIDQLFFVSDTGFEDILPATIWLSAASWFSSTLYGEAISKTVILQESIVLCAISSSFLLKAIPPNVLKNDPLFLKRLLLSLIGGFLMWMLVAQVLLAHKMAVAAILFGGSIFTHLLLNSPENESSDNSSKFDFPVQFLVLVGVLTLVASRLLGMFGLLVIAPPALLCAGSSAAVAAGLYWCTRALFQGFQQDYNGNVTGINLLHPYVSASVYAGLALSLVVASLWLRRVNTWRDSIVFLGLAFLLPPACNYFLHEEPSSGYLFSLLSASIILVPLAKGLFAPALSKPKYPVLMLLPGLSIITAYLTNGLFEAGNHSTLQSRLYAAVAIAAVLAVTLIVSYFVGMNKQDKLQAKSVE